MSLLSNLFKAPECPCFATFVSPDVEDDDEPPLKADQAERKRGLKLQKEAELYGAELMPGGRLQSSSGQQMYAPSSGKTQQVPALRPGMGDPGVLKEVQMHGQDRRFDQPVDKNGWSQTPYSHGYQGLYPVSGSPVGSSNGLPQQPSYRGPPQEFQAQPSFQPQQQQYGAIVVSPTEPSVPTQELNAIGIQYLPPQQLKAMMEARDRGQPMSSFIVVDLRGADFAGGHIRGCTNIPSTDLIGNLDGAASQLQNAEIVIFHCLISRHRAPQCAKYYKERLQQLGWRQHVFILEGGYNAFRDLYSPNPALITQDAAMSPDQIQRQIQVGIHLGQQFAAAAPQMVR